MFRICRAAIPQLRRSRQGRILNTASIMAERPYASLIAYTSAKHGVAGLTKSLAVELGAAGITANYILPGAVLTGITKPILSADPAVKAVYDGMSVLGRMAQPEEIAAAFLFLASDEAAFITGHGLAVDGGALLGL
jgi:NAD(P)-dependent dehydrogenase (short-subunit alcohol dehydrogenase family)